LTEVLADAAVRAADHATDRIPVRSGVASGRLSNASDHQRDINLSLKGTPATVVISCHNVRPVHTIPAILAGSWRAREASTRNPRSRYGTTTSPAAFLLVVTIGGIGARSGVDAVRAR
jgi:hypothetical protein